MDKDRRLPVKKTKRQHEQDKNNLIKVYNQALSKPPPKHIGKNSISSWDDDKAQKTNTKINTRLTLTESEDVSE